MSSIPSPSKKDRGLHGEQQMGFFWGERGYFFVDGPSGAAGHRPNAGGEDGLAFRPSPEDLLILDNKSWARRSNVGSATAIDPTVNLPQNLDAMITKVQTMQDIPHQARILALLQRARQSLKTGSGWPSSVRLVIMNAGGQSTGVTSRLRGLGIQFVDYHQIPASSTPGPAVPQAPVGPGTPPASEPKTAPIISSRSRFAGAGRAAGGAVLDIVLSLILELIAAKFMEYLDRKKFEEKLLALEPKMNEKKREAYLAFMRAFGSQELGPLYYNIKIVVTATTIVVIAGSGSRNIPVLNLDVLSVVITNADINLAGQLYEKSETAAQKFGAYHPVIYITQTQFLTYSEPVKPL